jgi:hypothetical protein
MYCACMNFCIHVFYDFAWCDFCGRSKVDCLDHFLDHRPICSYKFLSCAMRPRVRVYVRLRLCAQLHDKVVRDVLCAEIATKI